MVKYLLCHNKEQPHRLFFLNVNTVEGKNTYASKSFLPILTKYGIIYTNL